MRRIDSGIISLAGAIKAGCHLRSRQCFGSYLDGRDGACALGSAFVSGKLYVATDESMPRIITKELMKRFSILESRSKCPFECGFIEPEDLINVITHLNDVHKLSRGEIVEWLTTEKLC